jgi:hypothetical protein
LGIEHHVRNHTYRADRHGPIPAGYVAPIPEAPKGDWQPTPAQMRTLRREGRRFIEASLAAYALTPREGEIALRAAILLDEATFWRLQARRHGKDDPVASARAGRLALAHERAALAAMSRLGEAR